MEEEAQNCAEREQLYRRERRSVPAAREFARVTLEEWGFDRRADEVLLCVSELATNALVHGVPPGRGFLLLLRRELGGTLRVELHDTGDGEPRIPEQPAEPERDEEEGGRGLLLVNALADKWDVGPRDPGKIVWCEFAEQRPHEEAGRA